MLVVVVTGGLASGKSVVTRFLEERGAHVIELDPLAKSLLDEDESVRSALVAAFGEGILDAEGAVVRSNLAAEAFRCEATARTLDAIVHPRVVELVEKELDALALSGRPPTLVAIEVPLLAEEPALANVADLVVAVEAPEEIRVARAVARGMEEGDARARIAVQATDEERRALADVVLKNEADPNTFRSELEAFWEEHIAPRLGADGGR